MKIKKRKKEKRKGKKCRYFFEAINKKIMWNGKIYYIKRKNNKKQNEITYSIHSLHSIQYNHG